MIMYTELCKQQSGDLQAFPKSVDIVEHLAVEVLVSVSVVELAEVVDAGIEDLHGFLAQFLLILLALIDERVRGGIVDILGVRDRGLLGEHVVDENLRELLVLAAGRDAHGVHKIVGALGVIELQIHTVGLGVEHCISSMT